MFEVYIVSAVRTPIGRFGGMLAKITPVDLGVQVMQAALAKAGISGDVLDLYIFGNVLGAGHGQLLPRQAALKTGIPNSVDGYTVDMVCSSGAIAIINAAMAIRAGEANLVLAGGIESMSQSGFLLSHRARWGYKLLANTPETLTDLLLHDGLMDATTGESMGEQTERLVCDYGFSRQDLDEVALSSHSRAAAATKRGSFRPEIIPIELQGNQGRQIIQQDEGIRPHTNLQLLAQLAPAFKANGVLTAGNSSQISDGAAALVLASQSAVENYGLKPIAKILGGTWTGGETWRFPELSISAVKKLLAKLRRSISDFDLFENNEAFAINSLLFTKILGVDMDRLNVNGGAIALGHPLGASGARIVVTLVNALRERDLSLGIASICHGTGGGTAIALERV